MSLTPEQMTFAGDSVYIGGGDGQSLAGLFPVEAMTFGPEVTVAAGNMAALDRAGMKDAGRNALMEKMATQGIDGLGAGPRGNTQDRDKGPQR